MKQSRMRSTVIGIFAPASVIPKVELRLGVNQLKLLGFQVKVHPQVFEQSLFFAGTDESRAKAFLDLAYDDDIDVLWAARGGYGSFRMIQAVEKILKRTKRKPPKPKLILGYSDITVLHSYLHSKWGWSALHSPIPASKDFSKIPEKDLETLGDLVQGIKESESPLKYPKKLKWITHAPKKDLKGEVAGGNLAILTSLIGTSMQPKFAKNTILFLEDVAEAPYKIDRMMKQWVASKGLNSIQAIVLGTFSDCRDTVPGVFADGSGQKLKPLRKTFSTDHCLREIFGWVGNELEIPVALGLPIGHGGVAEKAYFPLPLGAKYSLSRSGEFKLLDWSWLR